LKAGLIIFIDGMGDGLTVEGFAGEVGEIVGGFLSLGWVAA
jgi:hypothetical protein